MGKLSAGGAAGGAGASGAAIGAAGALGAAAAGGSVEGAGGGCAHEACVAPRMSKAPNADCIGRRMSWWFILRSSWQ